MDDVTYDLERALSTAEFQDVLTRSTLAERRPKDAANLSEMLSGASHIVTARSGGLLVGIARAVSDNAFCTYLSDLAVDAAFQGRGIGKQLVRRTHEAAGLHTRLILLSAPAAQTYYPHIGMERHDSCWTIPPQNVASLTETQNDKSSLGRFSVSSGAGEFFDEIADCYNATIHRCFPRYSEMLATVIDYTPVDIQPKRILELGAGTGNLSIQIRQRYPESQLELVDLSQQSIDVCRTQIQTGSERLESLLQQPGGKVVYHCNDMTKLDFRTGDFDLIYSSIAVHHLPAANKQKLLGQCRDWLADDGAMIIADQCRGATDASYQHHVRRWKELSFRAGTTQSEWDSWMVHQRDHDHHETLADLRSMAVQAGFTQFDIVWRYLLWSVMVIS